MLPEQLNRLRELSELCENGKARLEDLKQLNELLSQLNDRELANAVKADGKSLL